jgi:tetratricopeptide (TPR) repeat protein
VHVHVINLDRSPDRLAEFRSLNGHLAEITRFPAVDGQRLDIPSLAAQGLAATDILSMYRIGAVGDAMSNIALWETAIRTGRNVTIAEDDAIFNRQFDRCAEELIAGLPPDWDLISWGFNFDLFMSFEMLPGVSLCVAQFEQERLRTNVDAFRQQSIAPRAYRLRWAFGTPCYTVSPKGALALKSKCLPLRPMLIPCPEGAKAPPHARIFRNVGIDNTLNSVYPDLNAYVCFPPLVVVKNEPAKSTIQAAEPTSAPAAVSGARSQAAPQTIVTEDAWVDRAGHIESLRGQATAMFEAGKFDEAVAAADRLLALKGDDLAALNMRGLALESLGRLEEALAAYGKAIAVEPGGVETRYNRANVLADLQRFDEALRDYDHVAAARRDFVPALYNRAIVLEQLGRLPEALAGYDAVLAISADHAGARENHRALRDELDRQSGPPASAADASAGSGPAAS